MRRLKNQWQHLLIATLFGAFCACRIIPVTEPDPNSPIPTPTEVIYNSTPTPTPISIPVATPSGPFVRGQAYIDIEGLEKIPLRIVPGKPGDSLDDSVLFVLTEEREGVDLTAGAAGVHWRGPTFSKGGALIRSSANISYDRAHEDNPKCSEGMEYGARQPAKNGRWLVTWDEEHIRVTEPGGNVMSIEQPCYGCLAFSRVVPGNPWMQRPKDQWRFLLWHEKFNALFYGVSIKVVSISGTVGTPNPCP